MLFRSLADEVQKCVKYNKIYNITNAYGMSVYFPYSSLKSVNSMAKIYDNLDIDDSYADSVKSFAALESSGQIVSSQMSGNTSLFDVLLSGGSSSAPASSYTGSSQSSMLESIRQTGGLRKTELAGKAGISEFYLYQILKGQRKPARDTLLAICLGLKCTEEQTGELLRRGGYSPLYVRFKRDSVVLYGIMHGWDVPKVNDMLCEQGECPLGEE